MKKINYIIWQEEKHFVSQCLENNVSSFGISPQEAKENLIEALELFYENESVDEANEIEIVQFGRELINA